MKSSPPKIKHLHKKFIFIPPKRKHLQAVLQPLEYNILQPRISVFFPMRLNENFSLLSKFLQIYYVLIILFATMGTCNELTFVRNQFNDLGGSIKTAKKSLAL